MLRECYYFDLFHLKLPLGKLSPNLWTKNTDFHSCYLVSKSLLKMLLEIVLGLTVILVLKWIRRRKQDLQVLQKLGYKVPDVNFIGGNLIELFTR